MRACFDFFGAKKLGGGGTISRLLPKYRPAKRSKLEFMTIYMRELQLLVWTLIWYSTACVNVEISCGAVPGLPFPHEWKSCV